MKQTLTKETNTGTPDVGTDPMSWARDIFGAATQIGVVLADNLTRQQDQVVQRQPSAAPVPWYQQPMVLIGGGVALLLVLVLAMRRR